MKDIERRIDVLEAMKSMNIQTPGSRVGHSQRHAAMSHVEEMRDGGYLDEGEAQARINNLLAAKTGRELAAFTTDLPAPRDRRPGWQKLAQGCSWDRRATYVPILVIAIIAFVNLAVLPAAIAGHDHWWTTLHGLLLVIPAIITGSVMTTVCSCWLISKAAKRD